MPRYLGEVIVNQSDIPEFRDYTKEDWAMYYISSYGQIDGSHHKDWVLDQVARILKGSQIEIKKATWDNGKSEYRVEVVELSKEYEEWVKSVKSGEDGPDTYDYSCGVAP